MSQLILTDLLLWHFTLTCVVVCHYWIFFFACTHFKSSCSLLRKWENINFFSDALISFNRTGCSLLFMLSSQRPPFWACWCPVYKQWNWKFLSECFPPNFFLFSCESVLENRYTSAMFANTVTLFGHRHTSCITGLADLPNGCEVWTSFHQVCSIWLDGTIVLWGEGEGRCGRSLDAPKATF